MENAAQAHEIISYHGRHWLREEYHNAWKSGGTRMEESCMQTRDNVERMVLLAFIAVRGMALRQGGLSEKTLNESCEQVLILVEWKLL